MPMIRIMLVAEPSMLREGMRAVLLAVDDFALAAETAGGPTAVAAATRLAPDVVVTDALPTAVALRGEGAATRVVLLAGAADEVPVDRAARAGVDGFVLTAEAGTSLIAAVRAVARGDAWLSPPFARRLLDLYRAAPAVPRANGGRRLSERERSVLRLVAHGRTNAEIAHELVLGESTVKTHVSRLLTKLELRDRVQLAVFAHSHGLT
ncbi:response regulator transcription factor [Phytohabitans sp. ZYX-F-186]|uniref:Response regulator transcription factor n=1 Tax=Phytohabitans maris TaxID=3071409 RepID=A0ABU0ZMC3_9ACTN|nr:response regulator transcription factor [Phytohabitans sp. ZYX-F-186]MDQ7908140.1 response regulator transcription factor [Phytohabitans sp. ZYX-F-186]